MSVTTRAAAIPLIKPAGRELELKFLVSAPDFKATQQWPMLLRTGARRATRLRSRYFDTPQGDLHRARMSLRLRALRRGHVLTLKYDGAFQGGLFERGEVEVFSAEETPDPRLLGPECAAAIEEAIKGRALVSVYETDIRRITHKIDTETSEIEVALDAGFIIAGERRMPIREIELELKAGDPADLYRLGMALPETFPVRLGVQSKSERGFQVSTGTPPSVARAPNSLAGALTVDEAIGALLGGALKQFTGNWPAFESGDSVNAVHQMRVSLRRLRALLGLFHRSFPCAEFQHFREAAKRTASAMNEARNLDVFLALLRDGPLRAFPGEAGLAGIIGECEGRRAAAQAQLGALLAAAETTVFVLSLQAFIARHGWRNALVPEALTRLTAPAHEFAALHIERLHRKILKNGGKRLKLSPHGRHQLRIDLKKLRYAADAFGGLFEAAKPVRAYTKAASALQDALGGFNDLITAGEMVGGLAAADTRAAGIILGWCGHGALRDDSGLLEAWKAFRKLRPIGMAC